MIWCPQCKKLVEPTLKRGEERIILLCPNCGYVFATSLGVLSLDEEERRFKLWLQGLMDVEIAEKLGLSDSCIRGWRERRGLPANRPNRRMRTYKPFLDAVPSEWTPAREVAEKLNCSTIRAAKMLKRLAELGYLERVRRKTEMGNIYFYRRVK